MLPSLHPKNAQVQEGFSLLEVMVAIVVLTIGLMSGALLMANLYQSSVRSRYMAVATQLASEELEDLNRYPASSSYIDPHIAVPAGSSTCGIAGETCIGSLAQDCDSGTTPACGSTATVSYHDSVWLTTQAGAMSETYQMTCTGPPAGNGNYVTVAFSPNGQAPTYPAPCYTSPPLGMSFDRRWVIEQNQPVAGVRRITVLVTLADKTLYPPVTFQMSMVRP